MSNMTFLEFLDDDQLLNYYALINCANKIIKEGIEKNPACKKHATVIHTEALCKVAENDLNTRGLRLPHRSFFVELRVMREGELPNPNELMYLIPECALRGFVQDVDEVVVVVNN